MRKITFFILKSFNTIMTIVFVSLRYWLPGFRVNSKFTVIIELKLIVPFSTIPFLFCGRGVPCLRFSTRACSRLNLLFEPGFLGSFLVLMRRRGRGDLYTMFLLLWRERVVFYACWISSFDSRSRARKLGSLESVPLKEIPL